VEASGQLAPCSPAWSRRRPSGNPRPPARGAAAARLGGSCGRARRAAPGRPPRGRARAPGPLQSCASDPRDASGARDVALIAVLAGARFGEPRPPPRPGRRDVGEGSAVCGARAAARAAHSWPGRGGSGGGLGRRARHRAGAALHRRHQGRRHRPASSGAWAGRDPGRPAPAGAGERVACFLGRRPAADVHRRGLEAGADLAAVQQLAACRSVYATGATRRPEAAAAAPRQVGAGSGPRR